MGKTGGDQINVLLDLMDHSIRVEHVAPVLLHSIFQGQICLLLQVFLDGVITDLEPDILECEVKWALESITMDKASGGDGIPVELFQNVKDDAVKVLHSICQQI